MDKQLEDMAGRERSVTVRGHVIKVHEVKMKNLRAFTAACGPFLHAFDEAAELASPADPDKRPDDFALFRLLAEHSDAFMEAAAQVSNAPRTFYEQLGPDEFFEVARLVVEVNGDFFVRALAPALLRFARGVSLIGSTLSNTLSPAGIDSVMSSNTGTAPSTASQQP